MYNGGTYNGGTVVQRAEETQRNYEVKVEGGKDDILVPIKLVSRNKKSIVNCTGTEFIYFATPTYLCHVF